MLPCICTVITVILIMTSIWEWNSDKSFILWDQKITPCKLFVDGIINSSYKCWLRQQWSRIGLNGVEHKSDSQMCTILTDRINDESPLKKHLWPYKKRMVLWITLSWGITNIYSININIYLFKTGTRYGDYCRVWSTPRAWLTKTSYIPFI